MEVSAGSTAKSNQMPTTVPTILTPIAELAGRATPDRAPQSRYEPEGSHDADRFREALQEKGITPCIPGRKSRNTAVKSDTRRYKRRRRGEIMFSRLNDWCRVATRDDRCPTTFSSAIARAAAALFRL